ncbi:S-layer homology domain-containing protein [Lysinibacillus sphaericus]|uniref:S-layer homology domain-containing protein n=1 Tax=Lysinibacillus sphaericus TaxID=1421 RepID=UPI003D06F421
MKKIIILAFVFILSFSTIFASSANAASVFSDVEEIDPNYNDLKFLYDRELMLYVGDAPHYFGKGSKASRNGAVIIIAKIMGIKRYITNTPYKDVSPTEYNNHTGYILELSKLGIIKGYSDGTFRPNETLTRGHLALFIDRAFGDYLPEGNSGFSDVPKSNEAYKAVKKLVGAGITTGYSDGTFKPGETLSNVHLHVFMARLVRYLEEQDIKVPLNGQSTENNETKQPTQPTQLKSIDDSKIKLGMSKTEVYELVKHRIIKDHSDDITYVTNIARNGLEGRTNYRFTDKGELRRISHDFNWSSLISKPNSLKQMHEVYVNEFIQEFGQNYETISMDKNNIMTTWDTSSNLIVLSSYYVPQTNDAFVNLILSDKKLDKK